MILVWFWFRRFREGLAVKKEESFWTATLERFQAKWAAGSREENASKQKVRGWF